MQVDACDTSTYNALPNLDEATTRLAGITDGFERFIDAASAKVHAAGFRHGEIGAFLLHRHWELPASHIMVERPRLLESGKVGLITAATETDGLQQLVAPSRWILERDILKPLEFSVDPWAMELSSELARRDELCGGLAELLKRHGLADVIGYLVVPRKVLTANAAGPFTDFLEVNQDGISIVTAENLSPIEKLRSIRTGWPLGRGKAGPNMACCYCMHTPDTSCRHPKPDPPVCRPNGCV